MRVPIGGLRARFVHESSFEATRHVTAHASAFARAATLPWCGDGHQLGLVGYCE